MSLHPSPLPIPYQGYRELRLEEMQSVLESLWEALEVGESSVQRTIVARLLSGPSRLHSATMEKVRDRAYICRPLGLGICHSVSRFGNEHGSCQPATELVRREAGKGLKEVNILPAARYLGQAAPFLNLG